jgi:hypothetical protein
VRCKVQYQDITGKKKTMQLAGWQARIFQHEYDHLEVRRLPASGFGGWEQVVLFARLYTSGSTHSAFDRCTLRRGSCTTTG